MADGEATSSGLSYTHASLSFVSPQPDASFWGASQSPTFRIACREMAGDIDWRESSISAIAIGTG